MAGRIYDDVIVGQGLAGTTLAWQLRWSGRSVLVIDRDAEVTSSSIAAGLMTPVTGQRLATAWRWDDLWPLACDFYERVERETGATFFSRISMLRLFSSSEERQLYATRRCDLADLVRDPLPNVDPNCFENQHGGFEMPDAGHLDVPEYLQASRKRFITDGGYRTAIINPQCDVTLHSGGVALPRLGIRARRLTWCQGIAGVSNPAFASVRFNPAKGEILRLRIPGLVERRVIHCGVWLLPLGDGQFLAGSTYDWDHLDRVPTPAGWDEITSRLRMFLRLPFDVVGHVAAVRPTLHDFRPVLGVHPKHPQMAVLNGLGSKGALYAPGLAAELVHCLDGGREPDPEVNCRRWVPVRSGVARPRLTELAHRIVQSHLRSGEFAVDATAGNGRDTCFLAMTVGLDGHVTAFDIQELALERTAGRLREAGLHNVTLVQRDHADLLDLLPPEAHGNVGAVMFNLGYLPGADHSIVTQPESTVRAVKAGLDVLRTGGVLTIVAYPGHGGGASETEAVEQLLGQLPRDRWGVEEVSQPESGEEVPRLFRVARKS